MGCSASKTISHQAKNPERRISASISASNSCNSSPLPVTRAFSLGTPLVHHPPLRKGDTHHLVSLTSTTYGSLLLIDHPKPKISHSESQNRDYRSQSPPKCSKIVSPTDSEHALSPDSVINTWELMDGLDDSGFASEEARKSRSSMNDRPMESPSKPISCRYTEFDGSAKKLLNTPDSVKSAENGEEKLNSSSSFSPIKPLWRHISEESLLAKLDPNVASSYRRALSARQLCSGNPGNVIRSVGSSPLSCSVSDSWFRSRGTENKIVIYFTSLRGIRKTYEDCCSVRMIFRGFRVPMDERDISMDSSYRRELQAALGAKSVSLPQVFIRGKHIGGVEEIKQLNENGELAKLLEGFPVTDPKLVCESCGDARFLPCPNCNGSRKLFDEEEGKLRRCPYCNENGLIRCPTCCS